MTPLLRSYAIRMSDPQIRSCLQVTLLFCFNAGYLHFPVPVYYEVKKIIRLT